MYKLIVGFLGCCMLTPVALSAPDAKAPAAEAYVNGVPVNASHVDALLQRIPSAITDPRRLGTDLEQRRAAARKELATQEALAQAALKDGLDKNAAVADALAYMRREALSRAHIEHYFLENPISDQALRAGYEWNRANGKIVEYQVRHILVPTEQEAADILARLKKGEKFEELVKLTKDPGGSTNGGFVTKDGWFRPDIFIDYKFADAIEALKPGSYSAQPLQTRFGWHVIKLDAGPRPVANPEPFEQLHEGAVKAMREKTAQRKLKELVAGVVEKAKMTDAKGKPLEK